MRKVIAAVNTLISRTPKESPGLCVKVELYERWGNKFGQRWRGLAVFEPYQLKWFWLVVVDNKATIFMSGRRIVVKGGWNEPAR